MRIEDKERMYELLIRGQLGNRLRIWTSEEDYRQSVEEGYDGLVGVRSVGRQKGLPYYHHKKYEEAVRLGREIEKKYGCAVCYYEASKDDHIIIQGELTEYPHGFGLEYSTVKGAMREAFAAERLMDFRSHIPAAVRRAFNGASYEELLWIFDRYPGSTVEFTAYDVCVGVYPGRNVCFWEVRHY